MTVCLSPKNQLKLQLFWILARPVCGASVGTSQRPSAASGHGSLKRNFQKSMEASDTRLSKASATGALERRCASKKIRLSASENLFRALLTFAKR